MNLSSEEARIFAENIVDTVREALIILDENLRVVSASRSFYRQFQVTREQTEGRSIYKLGNRQWDIPELRRLLESVIPEQTTVEDFEVRHQFESIGDKVMLLNARRILREQGKSALILLAIEDTTEHYMTRRKLAVSEANYRNLVEEINSIIIGVDRQVRITFFNHFSEKVFGYNRNEVIGKPFVGTIIPCKDSLGRDNAHLCHDLVADPDTYYINESEGICRDGSRVRFSWSAKAVRDSADTIVEILIDGNDLTELVRERERFERELKRESDELAAAEERLRVAYHAGRIGAFEWNIQTGMNTWTPELEAMYGLAPGEFARTQRAWEELVFPDDRPGAVEKVNRTLETGEPAEGEWRTVWKDGSVHWISGRFQALRDSSGKSMRLIGVNIDITERKRLNATVEELSRFPDETPNPILRFSSDGTLKYANTIGKSVFYEWKCSAGESSVSAWRQIVIDVFSKNVQHSVELSCEGRVFSLQFVPVVERDYVNVYGREITELKQAEDALHKALEKAETGDRMLRALMDNVPEGISICDAAGNVLEASKHGQALLGGPIAGKSIDKLVQDWEVYRPDGLTVMPTEEIPLVRALRGEVVRNIEIIEKNTNGHKLLLLCNAAPIRSDGKIVGGIIAWRDITERKLIEKQLQDERDFVNAVIQTSGALITVIDRTGRINRFNHACEELTGYTAEEVKGRTMFNLFIPPEEQGDVIGVAARLFAGVKRVDYENHWITKTGDKRFIRWQNTVLLDDKGAVEYAVATGIDITDRRRTEEALRESESRFRGIFDNVALGILQVDTSDHLVAANDYICRMLGYSVEELLKMDVHQLTAPEDRAKSDELNEKIHRKELRRVAYEKRYLKADGSKLWVSVTVSSIRDDKDRHISSITTVEDIMERKGVEQALLESEAGLKRAQEIAHLGSWELDLIANRLIWSDEIYRIFGLQPREFSATYDAFLSHVHPEDRTAVDSAYTDSVREGRDSYEIEHRVVRKDTGEVRYVHEKCQHVRDSQGRIIRSLGMVHDITERRYAEEQIRQKVEQLESANNELERFNRIAVGREMRMFELKREINALCVQRGEQPRYVLPSEEKEP